MELENAVLKCKLESDKKWAKIELDMQKMRDDIGTLLNQTIPTMETRLNKQAQMVGDIQQISLNVASLSQNMQQMLEEMKKQNDRIENLEKRPMKRWDNILDTIIKLVITAAIGAILLKIGLAV